jgi:hypothetical protein
MNSDQRKHISLNVNFLARIAEGWSAFNLFDVTTHGITDSQDIDFLSAA